MKRKAYRPRIINAPVTEGLLATFRSDAHAIETGLRMQPNAHLIDSALRLLNTVGLAATTKKLDRAAVVIIQSAALHLGTVCERQTHTGQWSLTPVEMEQVMRGMEECLRILGKLDVKALMLAYAKQGTSQ